MWLVPRDTNGKGSNRIPLPPDLRAALIRWYVGKGTVHDEKAGITLVQQARIGQNWIACDCLGADKAPAILTPAFLSEAETYYLRRLTSSKRPEHLPDCPFFRDQVTIRISEVRSRSTPLEPPAGFFEVLKPAPEKLAQRPEDDSNDDRTRSASIPRLARLLWRLMAAAGVNRIAPLAYREEWSIRREFAALTRAAGLIEIAPGIQLEKAFWTHPKPLQARAVYATLRALEDRWPRDHAPQGFVLLYAKGIHGQEITLPDGDTVTIANRIQSPSVRGNPIAGPFLVIIVVGKYPEAKGYAPLRAYAQPILNGRLFAPVDSDFERDVFRTILRTQQELHGRGIDLAIDKPVFDTLTPDGPCRPDFMIEARSRETGEIRNLVVEAMGFKTEEYEASKAITHPRMAHLGQIVTINRQDDDAHTGRRALLEGLGL